VGFPYDSTGVNTDGPQPAPADVYWLEIVDATDQDKEGLPLSSKKTGAPMVKCKLKIAEGQYAGRSFFHWVTFLPKDAEGAGIAVNFLKHINEPWQGQFEVDPDNWIGKKLRAKVKCEEDNQGRKRNSIQWLVDETTAAVPGATQTDEVPF
jgi:hypothetical protein